MSHKVPIAIEVSGNGAMKLNVCRLAWKHGYLAVPSFEAGGTLNFEESIKYKMALIKQIKAKIVWYVVKDTDLRLNHEMQKILKQYIAAGMNVRYFRTSDNGHTLREVANFNE